MRPKTCIVLATKLEAKPILQTCKLETSFVKGPLEVFHSDRFDLAIVGIGPVRSAISTGFLSSMDHEAWVNLGVAGSLNDDYSFKDVLEVGRCFSRDDKHPFDRSCDEILLKEDGVSLVTVGKAIHNDNDRLSLGKEADLVDMEGYSIAMSAKMFDKKLRMLKVVSDDASDQSVEQVVKNIPECMQKLWNKVEFDDLK